MGDWLKTSRISVFFFLIRRDRSMENACNLSSDVVSWFQKENFIGFYFLTYTYIQGENQLLNLQRLIFFGRIVKILAFSEKICYNVF